MRTLLFGVLAAAAVFFQASVVQPPSPGSLVIAGHVVTGSGPDARPVRRARVTLSGGSLKVARETQTDTKGTYRFDRLPFGNYHLVVQKPGFVKLEADATPDAMLTMVRGGAIEGTVADVNGDPVPNVAVSALQTQPNGATPKLAVQTRTDDLGRYRIHSLKAGEYLVQAATDQMDMAIFAGQRPPALAGAFYPSSPTLENAKAVSVPLGSEVSGIDVTFTPNLPLTDPANRPPRPPGEPTGTARISGRITDGTSGKPIKNAHLALVPLDAIRSINLTGMPVRGGRARAFGTTDPGGRFEFTNLPAGQYTLQASADRDRYISLEYGRTRPGEAGVAIDVADGQDLTLDMSLPRTSAIEGEVLDEFGDPAPGIIVHVARQQYVAGRQRLMVKGGMYEPTDDQGRYRISGLDPGDYYVTALAGAFADPGGMAGFAPTHYPGTSDASAAAPISVSPGADALNVSFALVPTRALTVSGVMVDADGKPVSGRGTLILETPDQSRYGVSQLTEGFTSDGGQFIFRDVPEGSYTLQGYGAPPSGRESPGQLNTLPFGWLPVTVGDSDVDGLVLRVTNGTTLRGRITLDREGGPALTPQQVRVSPAPIEFDSAPVAGGSRPSATHDDWTFQVTNVFGRDRIFVNVASPDWIPKKITHNGIDITDEALDFREKDVAEVEVVLTSRVTRVTGSVSADRGLVNDYAVVIFSSDPTKWIDRSRFVVMARGVQHGRFEVRALAPDDYLAVALPNVTGTEWMDPAFLQAVRPFATAFTLQEGESKTLELKLKPRP